MTRSSRRCKSWHDPATVSSKHSQPCLPRPASAVSRTGSKLPLTANGFTLWVCQPLAIGEAGSVAMKFKP